MSIGNNTVDLDDPNEGTAARSQMSPALASLMLDKTPSTNITEATPIDTSPSARFPFASASSSREVEPTATPQMPPPSSTSPLTPTSPSAVSTTSSTFSRPSPGPLSSGGGGPHRTRPASALVSSGLTSTLPKPRSNSSLQSSRPAPPSPASSRPASQILSSPGLTPHVSPRASAGGLVGLGLAGQGSSSPGRDRAGSASSAPGRRLRPRSTLGTSTLIAPTVPEGELATVSEPVTPWAETSDEISTVAEDKAMSPKSSPVMTLAATLIRRVIVRDYAYPSDDQRYLGLGPTRPRSNWCEGEPEPEDPPEEPKSSWGGLSLGLGSWGGFLGRRAEPETTQDSTDYTLASGAADHDNNDYWSEDDEMDDDEDGEEQEEQEDPDGLFRAAYPFEPEGVNEMAVDVGDLLDVRGRGGGGDGWVIAIRLDTSEEGLVPEGYLEKVLQDECPDGWAHLKERREASASAATSREASAAVSAATSRQASAEVEDGVDGAAVQAGTVEDKAGDEKTSDELRPVSEYS